nr:hypothetical protein [Streptomyces sp. SID14515]
MYPSTTATVDGDLDLIAIEHAMNGEPVTLTAAERIETARQLVARGFTLTDAGRRVRADRNTIVAWQNNGWATPSVKPDPEPINIGNAQHGRSGYSKGCRCRTCKDGASAAKRAAKDRRAAA